MIGDLWQQPFLISRRARLGCAGKQLRQVAFRHHHRKSDCYCESQVTSLITVFWNANLPWYGTFVDPSRDWRWAPIKSPMEKISFHHNPGSSRLNVRSTKAWFSFRSFFQGQRGSRSSLFPTRHDKHIAMQEHFAQPNPHPLGRDRSWNSRKCRFTRTAGLSKGVSEDNLLLTFSHYACRSRRLPSHNGLWTSHKRSRQPVSPSTNHDSRATFNLWLFFWCSGICLFWEGEFPQRHCTLSRGWHCRDRCGFASSRVPIWGSLSCGTSGPTLLALASD